MITLTEKFFPHPTLALYLGGSGIQVGGSLLHLMEAVPAEYRPFLEAFFIDSQEPSISDHERARHYSYNDLWQFFEPVFAAFSASRFPENLGTSPVMNSSEGCGVTRIFGTASLIAKRDDFGELVEQAVARLRKVRQEGPQPLQVFLTASACGGTGAGMILDAAAMVRHFFRLRGENPRIFLFLIGPTVFFEDPLIPLREDQRDRMRASTYALIKELNHFAQGKEFISAYRLRDQVVTIGNARDDDRLFDWVYYVDGHPEDAGVTRSLGEVAWSIAEAQVHLALTEVGYNVAASLPNQREERSRDYALNFVHADNKEHLSVASRARLQISARKTFLASLSVRSVRFPANEIKRWFRWGWVREALQKTLRRERGEQEQAIDRFDRLLGISGGRVQRDGLLFELGLAREQLLERVRDDADPAQGVPAPLGNNSTPDRVMQSAEELVRIGELLLEDFRRDASLVAERLEGESKEVLSVQALLRRATPQWKRVWSEGLAHDGRIAARLWDLAWNPASGQGLCFLRELLTHTAKALTDLAAATKQRPPLGDLEERLASARERIGGLSKSRKLERSTARYWGRRAIARASGGSVYSESLQRKSKTLVQQLNALRQDIIEQRSAHIAAALAPRAWIDAAQELKRWRDEVLQPAITAAENAFTLADNQWKLARRALVKHQGESTHGRWFAHTTFQIAGDELLSSLGGRVANVMVEDLVLGPLNKEEGITRERNRLTVRSLAEFDRKTTVDILYAHVEARTEGTLTFLDNGWMLEEVAAQLHQAGAKALDEGAEPLTSFSRAAVGQPLQSYLLKPHDLILPEPFGRSLGRMNHLVSSDPLQLGVVSFVFGIPPNALEGMSGLFEQYMLHIGDQARNAAQDRYPLHVFREAAESFDEPHSPLSFQAGDGLVQSLPVAAHELWGDEVRLVIRPFDPAVLPRDWNMQIELTEKVLRHLLLTPADAERLFRDGRFPDLERLFNSRRFRSASSWTAGNGGKKPPGDNNGGGARGAGAPSDNGDDHSSMGDR